ncbi:TVP38/TMEM64 family protein [bacterium]|nr:TVP38/TMEM64 family protein [bacterium]
MHRLAEFLNNMDARAWRTVWVTLILFGLVGAMIVLGKTGVLGVSDSIEPFLESLRDSPLGLLATIAVFTLSAYIAAPQFILIAACVVAFGPVNGFLYSWAGTIVSGAATFYTGRLAGADFVRRYGGGSVNRLSRFIGRNDFLASLIVRNVPTAPFIVVNMVFGVSHARFWRYMGGLVIGVIPKTLIVALLGQSALSAMGGGVGLALGVVIAVVGIWITVALAARKAVRDGPAAEQAGTGVQEGSPGGGR